MDVLGVEPDMRRHGGQKHVLVRPEARHADALAFQIRDRSDALAPDHSNAADVHTGKESDRLARCHRDDQWRCKVRTEIELAARDCFHSGSGLRYVHIADINKTLGAEQLVGDVLGAMQMPSVLARRTLVVSGSGSSA